MPNYAQAAIQIRQKKEREAREREHRGQQGESGVTSGQRVRTWHVAIHILRIA
jgi:hypothetical protein